MSISYRPDLNIAASGDDVLVNTVNCVGVMGAGVAKAIRTRYPSVMPSYLRSCDDGRLVPGIIHVHRVENGPIIVNMATKQHWRQPSRIDWVGSGLYFLSRFLQQEDDRRPGMIRRITIPPPGCGHGGLDWTEVNAMLRASLAPVMDRGLHVTVTQAAPDAVEWPMIYAGIGARKTPPDVLDTMRAMGARLATMGFHLRSGGADGADTAFERGASSAGGDAEIFLVRPDARKPHGIVTISDCFARVTRTAHPRPSALSGHAHRLMDRNGSQIFGRSFNRPCDLVICWTPGGRGEGGTGQSIRLARHVGIPVLDLGLVDHDGLTLEDLCDLACGMALGRRQAVGMRPSMMLPETDRSFVPG